MERNEKKALFSLGKIGKKKNGIYVVFLREEKNYIYYVYIKAFPSLTVR
nr:MAG TPA: hypothetical protein [Caudoviricetes sp.]